LAPKGCTPAQPEPTPQRIFSTESSLDCDYLHVVFTLPHELNGVIAAHQKLLHDLHFRCVSAVLNETAEKEYGCEIGIVEVLHTWGQRLLMMWRLKAAKWRQVVAWDVSPRIAEQWA
jgi:hypothetical protein